MSWISFIENMLIDRKDGYMEYSKENLRRAVLKEKEYVARGIVHVGSVLNVLSAGAIVDSLEKAGYQRIDESEVLKKTG